MNISLKLIIMNSEVFKTHFSFYRANESKRSPDMVLNDLMGSKFLINMKFMRKVLTQFLSILINNKYNGFYLYNCMSQSDNEF